MIASIDSFKLRIPVSKVHFFKQDIVDRWTYVSESGVLDESEYKQRRVRHEEKGIVTSFLIEEARGSYQREPSLTILINAKILGTRYLEGIHSGNWTIVFEKIMNLGFFYIKPNDFLVASITDVDIKRDFQIKGDEERDHIIKQLSASTLLTNQVDKGHRVFDKNGNKGIQWSTRERATNSNPFVKLYSKDFDLVKDKRAAEFSIEFGFSSIPPTMRLEGTIKNKRHFESLSKEKLETESFSLSSLLTLKNGQDRDLDELLKQMTWQHVQLTESQRESMGRLTASQAMCLALLHNNDYSTANFLIDRYANDRHQRKRLQKSLEEVYNLGKHYQSEQEKRERKGEIFDFLSG